MKKFILIITILSCSIQASTQNSFLGKNRNVGIISATVASIGAISYGAAWWAWNLYDIDGQAYKTGQSEKSRLEKEQLELQGALDMTDNMKSCHMRKVNYNLTDQINAVTRMNLVITPDVTDLESYSRSHSAISCAQCNAEYAADNRGRSTPCTQFTQAHTKLIQSIKPRKDSVDRMLKQTADLEKKYPQGTKQIIEKRDVAQSIKSLSAITAISSAAVFVWNKFKN